ncbi:accessory Sec system protein Asp2 [Staphylococcus hyicus]|uniref:accessory Sec system protein Asp2 n=1 Tax=Staphylococcus hyicus TaxID=1284 RepID=UPI00211BD3A6|nr:accessory Sec system protein Asp2 [Staphylococcus hyicus]MCQ9307141.1 accessory Sec system protein Asp2 [Staphylococcus hyicus]MCQ9309275.1 accessory Sec system protein Asp2 [Staphylococcus hyicus]MCQ9311975.1 accessory Sec system protein Asp2 [Staphylococcus hyicus]
MARKFRVLQIGGHDYGPHFEDSKHTDWDYLNPDVFENFSDYTHAVKTTIKVHGKFDFVFVQTSFSEGLMGTLDLVSQPYTTYVDKQFWDTDFENHALVHERMIRPLYYNSPNDLYEKIKSVTFPGQYGDKVSPKYCIVSPSFEGEAHYEGNKALVISGDFGKEMTPILSWQKHLFYDEGKVIQIWPEFTVTGNVEVEFVFRLITQGTANTFVEEYVRHHTEWDAPLEIPRRTHDAYIIISARAKGQGTFHMGAVHKRWSRLDLGQFILGGKRFSDINHDEFIYYFNPGDMKPPLNVYFSGYRPAEGFEGYFMMNRFNAPFILIGDPRIEGGAFYLGSETFEQAIKNVIQDGLDYLGFNRNELILSGLSMGSFGALYYGAQLNPAGIVVGKPLINVGTIAQNMPLQRPEDFGTALDVLLKNEDGLEVSHIEHLNRKFWDKIENADFSRTTFAVAYMEQDDYDMHAFKMLLPVMTRQHARVMSRGVPGRHNDDSPTITSWFVNFYNIILESQFGRVTHRAKS